MKSTSSERDSFKKISVNFQRRIDETSLIKDQSSYPGVCRRNQGFEHGETNRGPSSKFWSEVLHVEKMGTITHNILRAVRHR